VGLGAVAASHFRGARTIAVDVDDEKLKLARAAGAAHTIHSAKENLKERIAEMTGGRGLDVVIEAIGTTATFQVAVELVAFTGRVVYIGYVKDAVPYETRLFVQKEIDILGSRNALPEDFREVIRMLEEHRFPVDDAISSIVPLEEAPSALSAWSENPSRVRKIMVRLN
jgi:threonine dehydrogenase-like Zn-dependent dehydrogenase